jgi:hypothetical protein
MLTAVKSPVRIEVAGCEPCEGRWRVRFRIVNTGASPIVLSDAWVPHGRFRGDGHVALECCVRGGATTCVALGVSAIEAPGTVVENAFLILRTSVGRVFARMRVAFDADAVPLPRVESVTVQSLE